MLDHHEIRRTLSDYCFACDRCDMPRMAAVYAEDSFDDHGVYAAPGKEFARIMAAAVAETTESLYHMLGQSQIRVTGDTAGAETYFFAASQTKGEDGKPVVNQLGGRFVDQLRREGERWLLTNRVVVRDWGISMPVTADWTEHAGLKDGQRSTDDPAFAALGILHSVEMAAQSWADQGPR